MGLYSLYGSLAVPLVFLAFAQDRQLYLLYMIICTVVAGWDGIAVGTIFWVLFSLLRFTVNLFMRRPKKVLRDA